MKMLVAGSLLFGATIDAGHAQVVVKQEPTDMRNGATVLVDDGTCGKGKIKRVTVTHGNPMSGAPTREKKCVPGETTTPQCALPHTHLS